MILPESPPIRKAKRATKQQTEASLRRPVPLGALVYYKPPNQKDLPACSARTFPGIFCGWRLDLGYKFRAVHLVLDCEALRTDQKGCGRPSQVRSAELAVPDTFVFPLHQANVEKLSFFVLPKS